MSIIWEEVDWQYDLGCSDGFFPETIISSSHACFPLFRSPNIMVLPPNCYQSLVRNLRSLNIIALQSNGYQSLAGSPTIVTPGHGHYLFVWSLNISKLSRHGYQPLVRSPNLMNLSSHGYHPILTWPNIMDTTMEWLSSNGKITNETIQPWLSSADDITQHNNTRITMVITQWLDYPACITPSRHSYQPTVTNIMPWLDITI